jgi:protein tyrosine phosphatase (PTP) superfamily phosphohydrolase (DUF442 family)
LPLYWLKWLGVLVMLALTACCGLWVHHTFLGTNFHAVVPGKIYRSAQLKAETLAEIVRRYGLRSVINLRGCCPEFDWYQQERQTLQSLNVRQYDIRFSYRAPPPVPELRNLVQVLSDCEKPVLLHCRRGADRTGLASGHRTDMRKREFGGCSETIVAFLWLVSCRWPRAIGRGARLVRGTG